MQYVFNGERLSKEVKTKRIIELDLGMREAAKKIKISPATLCRIENETHIPDIHSFVNICSWLRISPSEFFHINLKSKKPNHP